MKKILLLVAIISLGASPSYSNVAKKTAREKGAGDANKPIRKGGMDFTGTPAGTHRFHRQYTIYAHDNAMLIEGYVRPSITNSESVTDYVMEDKSTGTFELSATYKPAHAKDGTLVDKKDATLLKKQINMGIDYSVFSAIEGLYDDPRDYINSRPWCSSGAWWTQPTSTPNLKDTVGAAPKATTVYLNLGSYGSIGLNVASSPASSAKLIGDTIDPNGSPYPTTSAGDQIVNVFHASGGVGISFDAGWKGGINTLAQCKSFIVPLTGYSSGTTSLTQYGVTQAFVFSPEVVR